MTNTQYKMCGFGESIRKGFSKYATFRGRATRSEFWWFVMFTYVVAFAFQMAMNIMAFCAQFLIESKSDATTVLAVMLCVDILLVIAMLALTLPFISVSVRRLHDIGKSGWHYWLYLIPIYGLIVFIQNGCRDSQHGTNVYGPSGKYPV